MTKFVEPLVLIVLTVVLYGTFLDFTPVHLNQDELGFSLNAYSIAKSGFDENGRFLPFYFWHLGVMWSTPIIVYLTAFVLKFLPISEAMIRFTSVFIGVLDIVLIYYISEKIFKSKLLALAAGGLLLLLPPHFIHSRLLLDNLYIVPFILGWFLLLLIFKSNKSLTILFFSSFLLGVGIHSYHAAKIIMPVYLFFALIFLIPEIKERKRIVSILLIGFVLPLLPLIPWLSKYPDTLTDQVRYTGLYNTSLSPIEGLMTLLTWENLVSKFKIFISYFDFNFLFLKSDVSLIHSTRTVGVFLIVFLILLPLGLIEIIRKRSREGLLIIAGFLTSPIAPAFVGNQYRVSKELLILPFGVLIATFGVKFLLRFNKRQVGKIALFLIAIILMFQFIYFIQDYYGGYRNRSYNWFNYDIAGAYEELIKLSEKESADFIYIDQKIPFGDRYWKFYLLKHQRTELANKTIFFDTNNFKPDEVPSKSLILYRFDSLNNNITQFAFRDEIREPDSFTSFYIYHN